MSNSKERFRSVLIFGGAGFIGSNWALRLLQTSDAKVHVFDNLSRPGVRHNLEELQRAAGNSSRLKITVADIRDAAMVQSAVRWATEIYHFAAQVAVTTSVADPALDFQVNVQGTFNILEAIRKSGQLPFLLFTSTNKVYGDLAGRPALVCGDRCAVAADEAVSEAQPLDFHSPYGCSKGAADQYVRDYSRVYGIRSVVLRMSCICGPRQFGTEDQGWVAHFLYAALQNKPVMIYGDGRQVRDVLDVADLLEAFEGLRRQQSCAGQIYNVGGGEANAVSLLELIARIERLTGRRLNFVFDERRLADQRVYVTNFDKLQRAIAWRPKIAVSESLKRIHEWWKENRELFPAADAGRASDVFPVGLEELPRTA